MWYRLLEGVSKRVAELKQPVMLRAKPEASPDQPTLRVVRFFACAPLRLRMTCFGNTLLDMAAQPANLTLTAGHTIFRTWLGILGTGQSRGKSHGRSGLRNETSHLSVRRHGSFGQPRNRQFRLNSETYFRPRPCGYRAGPSNGRSCGY